MCVCKTYTMSVCVYTVYRSVHGGQEGTNNRSINGSHFKYENNRFRINLDLETYWDCFRWA